ncbi:MAG TPA: sigma-70 family RNA polymerase sigma factor [Burkholderiales bacterium]|nr:sigma-70 family RNA polymerase sigma factor [Burkholderiales bacterium]
MATDAHADAIDVLYNDHYGWLRRWLHRKLGCSHQAADLAHDTFLRVLLHPSPEPLREPRAYLSKIAGGLVVNHWRRLEIERAYLAAVALLPQPVAPSPETRAETIETLVAVDAMLAILPEKVKRAFLLAQLDGKTYAEIATELRVSERMVKKYMANAMLNCLIAAQNGAA